MDNKISSFFEKIDFMMLIAYALAIAIIAAVVFYLPEGFIGFVIGAAFGLNRDKLESMVTKNGND